MRFATIITHVLRPGLAFDTSVMESRVVAAAVFALLQENASLLAIEFACYLCAFLLLLHIHSSGKRNATMLLAATLQVVVVDQVFFSSTRWHAQSLVCRFV